MKQLAFLVLSLFLISCGGNDGRQEGDRPEGIATQPAETDLQAQGRQLIANSDCVACHKDNERVIGPSYTEVAQKYPNNDSTIAYLAGKIIQGGSGVWGSVPMTAHPQHSQEEAEQMARYILSLNTSN
ncbi:c-type cytochrome [Cesiribacter andamanensis]|uniref:Cytochrome c552 n=1 Tax=Cesiribacter andamanensis AMV16 TaxID=1279009 RepID=M7N503_9BACT|nr:c-type cytochrome [Cesiribacter andamanensis]EMR02377.1 Cytochrome c552 [Cesiribacter andamanensis AMV16]